MNNKYSELSYIYEINSNEIQKETIVYYGVIKINDLKNKQKN
ncbi:hypothetical protein [Lysinibacillus xylanilyticus]|nr:hypothetical protein [Lysinibacillus xylanilyticus]MED3804874.1 hypothetical protein [Lysinibacillus xylanilyticus]